MAASYEYIISLQDKMSGTMGKIIGTSGTVVSRLESMSKKQKELQGVTGDLGGSIFSLKQKIDLLQAEKELIPASNIPLIRKYNNEIRGLNGNIDKLNNQTGTGLKKWTNDLTSAIPALKLITNPIVLATAGIAKLTQTVGSGIEAWNLRVAAETRLSAIMRNTMNATDADIKSILDLTSAQQKLGVVDAASQTAGAQELATYLSRRDSLEKLLPVMNDMLTQQYGLNATQEQAQNIAGMMGKVMDGQVGALSRYGYKFSEAQEKILKYGKETQRATVLAEVIAESIGGVNAALVKTPEGKWKQHENEMGELMERVGKVAVGFRTALFPVIEASGALFEKLVSWFEENSEAISGFLNKIGGVVSFALEGVFKVLGGIVNLFFWWWDALNTGNPVIWALTTAISVTTLALNAAKTATATKALWDKIAEKGVWELVVAQWGLNAALLANPIVWIVVGIASLIAAVVACWIKFAGFRAFLITMWDTIKKFGSIIKDYIIDRIKGFIEGIGALGNAIGKLFKGDFSGAWEAAKDGVVKITGFEAAQKAVNGAKDVINGVNSKYQTNLDNERKKDEEKKQKKSKTEDINGLANAPFNQTVKIDVDPVVNTDKEKSGKKDKTEKINIDNPVIDLKGSGAYSAIVSKLNPVHLASLATKAAATVAIPAMMATGAAAAIPGSPVKEFDAAKTEYVQERDSNPIPVKIVELSSSVLAGLPEPLTKLSVPKSVAVFENTSDGVSSNALPQETGSRTQTVHVERFCDQVVIHIANADNKGYDQIRSEVEKVLMDVLDNYET